METKNMDGGVQVMNGYDLQYTVNGFEEYYFTIQNKKIKIMYNPVYHEFFQSCKKVASFDYYCGNYDEEYSLYFIINSNQKKYASIKRQENKLIVISNKALPDNSVECIIKDAVNEFIFLPRNRFVTHGGLARINGEMMAFLGESGAGKTTFAKKFSHTCVNDERVVMGIEDEKAFVGNYPFGGREGTFLLEPFEDALSAILFLRKGKSTFLKKASKYESVKEIIRCTTVLQIEGFSNIVDYYTLISKIASIVPVYYLYSRLADDSVSIEHLFKDKEASLC